ncbi:hypothetical protein [Rhizobium sp. Root483D2]|uniref:hypothetical protein n=1 Tax=Rhizobium sp. Root483D2 TaxID=1736545 RepID=UPI0007137C0C|nr:hypothetical protein [Rhizobium sp. Root483D2]KQY45646.1 hypothetical protein ASD32_10510 [Rhizobium sp. Root483D2]
MAEFGGFLPPDRTEASMPFVLAQSAGLNSVVFPRWATDRRLRAPGRDVNIRSEWNMKNSAAAGGDT